jgi:hypothetical protein
MDGSFLGDALSTFFKVVVIMGILLLMSGVYIIYNWYVSKDYEMISSKKIVPELRLTIKDNKVDTLFVYKLKK